MIIRIMMFAAVLMTSGKPISAFTNAISENPTTQISAAPAPVSEPVPLPQCVPGTVCSQSQTNATNPVNLSTQVSAAPTHINDPVPLPQCVPGTVCN